MDKSLLAITAGDAILGKTTSTDWTDGYGLDSYSSRSGGALGDIYFWVNSYNGAAVVKVNISTNEWTHIAATYDLANTKIYKNGVLAQSAAFTTAISHSSNSLQIGRLAANDFNLSGSLDDVRIYSAHCPPTKSANLARGRYAAGNSSTSTFTLGANLSTTSRSRLGRNISTSNRTLTVTNALTMLRGGGNPDAWFCNHNAQWRTDAFLGPRSPEVQERWT